MEEPEKQSGLDNWGALLGLWGPLLALLAIGWGWRAIFGGGTLSAYNLGNDPEAPYGLIGCILAPILLIAFGLLIGLAEKRR